MKKEIMTSTNKGRREEDDLEGGVYVNEENEEAALLWKAELCPSLRNDFLKETFINEEGENEKENVMLTNGEGGSV